MPSCQGYPLYPQETPLCLPFLASWFDANQNEGDSWDSSTLTNNVVEFALIVGYTRTHLALERLHRKDFNANINMVAYVER